MSKGRRDAEKNIFFLSYLCIFAPLQEISLESVCKANWQKQMHRPGEVS
jgi:hypothetical protein